MLQKVDKFLEKYNLPKLIQEGTENLNYPVSNKEMEFVIKNLPRKKTLDPDSFTVNSIIPLRTNKTNFFRKQNRRENIAEHITSA